LDLLVFVFADSSIQSVADFTAVPDALNPFSIILVAAPIDSNILRGFVEYGFAKGVPVFYIHSVGFYSRLSILVPHAFPIVDTHPDPASTADLRLLKPWPALLEYARKKTEALDTLDDHLHGHVPYLLLILYYLEKWQEVNDGKLPSNYKEKNEFKKFLNAGMRMSSAEGSEENYEQAVAAVLKNLNDPVPNSAVKEVFNSPECTHLTGDSPNFWVVAHAISQFYQHHGVLPLPGSVPDMKAISSDYVELQNVYKSKARQDVETVTQTVRTIEQQIAKAPPIPASEIEAFCKGAAHIKLIRGKPFPIATSLVEDIHWGDQAKSVATLLTDETSGILLYIAFLAYDTLFQQSGVAPGTSNIEKDAANMSSVALAILSNLLAQAGKGASTDVSKAKVSIESYCHEL
jgi:amyloid beta precursor protein binding protein 1